METIFAWDRELLKLINVGTNNPVFDLVMPFLRQASFWLPLYLFLILFGVINYKQTGWWWVLFACLTGMLTNFVSSDIIKENIYRLRPCNDPSLSHWLINSMGIHTPKSSSFTSSHAANHFGLAMFLFMTLRASIGKWVWLGFVWAGAIVYAQMYVGVHYPLDILGGAIVGVVLGGLMGYLFNRQFRGLR